jgi:hypothetical protein
VPPWPSCWSPARGGGGTCRSPTPGRSRSRDPGRVIYACLQHHPGADARLAAVASAAGIAVCGANCMGFLNLEQSLRACAYGQPTHLRPGPVTFISHSGSAVSALLHAGRGVRFNLVVSAGTEFGTTMNGYLDYALTLPSTPRGRAVHGNEPEPGRSPAGPAAGRGAGYSCRVPEGRPVSRTRRTGCAGHRLAGDGSGLAGGAGGFDDDPGDDAGVGDQGQVAGVDRGDAGFGAVGHGLQQSGRDDLVGGADHGP